MDFNLRALVREVAESSTLTDPGSLADEIARRIPAEHVHDAFVQMLRPYVRELITKDRSFGTPTDHHEAPRPGRSWKRDGIRAHWRRVLRERVHVGVGPADWKFLGDCGREDLLFAAAERRQMAEANLAKAAQFEQIAALLDDDKTVRDLPDDTLAASLGEAA